VTGFVDLHCHWVWQIDDGARSVEEGIQMLMKLGRLGFSHVVATPHMRPGMFENTAQDLRRAYANTGEARAATSAFER
jgi:protein-tyrosine phosphatase